MSAVVDDAGPGPSTSVRPAAPQVGDDRDAGGYDAVGYDAVDHDADGYDADGYDDSVDQDHGRGHGAVGEPDVAVAAPAGRGSQIVQYAAAPTRAELRTDFGAHLEANYRRLVAQLYAITLDAAEAHTVVQDAYSRAWRSWAVIGRSPDPTGWVRRVAVRSTIRSWRRWRRGSRRPVGGSDVRMGALLVALRQLPAAERRCVVLHHMAGSPTREIAAVEGVAVGTIVARLARAQHIVNHGLAEVLAGGLGPDEPGAAGPWAASGGNEQAPAVPGVADDNEEGPR